MEVNGTNHAERYNYPLCGDSLPGLVVIIARDMKLVRNVADRFGCFFTAMASILLLRRSSAVGATMYGVACGNDSRGSLTPPVNRALCPVIYDCRGALHCVGFVSLVLHWLECASAHSPHFIYTRGYMHVAARQSFIIIRYQKPGQTAGDGNWVCK